MDQAHPLVVAQPQPLWSVARLSAQVKADASTPKLAAKATADTNAASTLPKLDVDTYNETVTAYNSLSSVGLAAEVLGTATVPNLSLRHNTIALIPTLLGTREQLVAPALLGVSVILAKEDATGALFLEGNNVEVVDYQ